jgi:hypothetical protein
MANYEDGKIYKIVVDGTDLIYVGSTCGRLSARISRHRSSALSKAYKCKLYEYDPSLWRIILVEEFPCATKDQLRAREEYWRKELRASLNSIKCFIEDKKVEERERWKRRHLMVEKYRSGIIECCCGLKMRRDSLRLHLRTKKHEKILASKKEVEDEEEKREIIFPISIKTDVDFDLQH